MFLHLIGMEGTVERICQTSLHSLRFDGYMIENHTLHLGIPLYIVVNISIKLYFFRSILVSTLAYSE